jgi:cell division septation protein DedD
MHDGSDDGFHEIQLSGKQLVFLFMATTVVSVVIFLCGVLVGRGVQAERGPEPGDPAVTAAPAPSDTVAEADPPAVEPPVPAEDSDPPLTYKDRLETDKPAQEELKAEGERARAAESEKEGATASARSSEPEARAGAPAARAPDTRGASKSAERTSAAARNPGVAAPGSRNTWVVQIVALRDRGAASSIVQRLSGKGYPAFVVNPTGGVAAPVFKVQVGRYADRNDAEQVARRLEREEQFKPWVSR